MSKGLEVNVPVEFSLDEAIYNCRAMRKLKADEVPEELLIKLVDAARQAPSGSNTQNSRWIVVRDPHVKRRLAEQNRKFAEPYIRPALEGNLGTKQLSPEKHRRQLQAVVWQIEHMHEIPALIVACFDYPEKVDGLGIYRASSSVWPGVQNLLLTARALGLGAAPTTLALRDQDAIREILNLPATFAALCLIPVGYPMGNFGPVRRRPVSEIMRFDTWNQAQET
ncbi:MAG: nitroreductase family protein [Gammaproteobacteria bacterium]|nr:nitroreductase family protein [Gammaproteobacteria bacterium]MDE0365106.1 nitroreductase family protein [Gammaproteobacteria bacterium]